LRTRRAAAEKRGVTEIEKIRIDLLPEQRDIMVAKTGRRTVPQIYIGEHHVAVLTTWPSWIARANWFRY